MASKGLKPPVATYNSMIDGWYKEGEIDHGVSCVAKMYEDEKDPDVVTYTSLIHGSCASGSPSEAISRWNEMKGKDCCPNVVTFMALIQGLCKCVWLSEALVYFREMEGRKWNLIHLFMFLLYDLSCQLETSVAGLGYSKKLFIRKDVWMPFHLIKIEHLYLLNMLSCVSLVSLSYVLKFCINYFGR